MLTQLGRARYAHVDLFSHNPAASYRDPENSSLYTDLSEDWQPHSISQSAAIPILGAKLQLIEIFYTIINSDVPIYTTLLRFFSLARQI